ncbi:MAG: lectin like domain-containing protein, partial [Christensenella sp.]|uniref:lectin like domain-containing protein n=1 Tax=Christensenella sp. TaxID=1935934 RepID=UPI002B21C0F0
SMGVYDAKSAEDAKSVWNEAKGAYYSKPETRSNHAVTLIGWDDTFSKDNFSDVNQPAGDGAWLIKNSWGDTPSSSGMNFLNAVPNSEGGKDCGYFWMSYYEGSIMTPVSYQVDVGADDYDNLVQYDYLNIRSVYSTIGEIIKTILTTKGITADKSVANVFTAQGYETLSAVSFNATAPGCNVDIQIYRNGSPGEIAERTPDVTLNTEAVESAGFHTLDLGEKAINLRPNEAYTIVQTITSKNESYLPVELGSELEKNPSGGMTGAQAVCNPGESYVQTSEGWTDLSQIGEVTLKEESKETTFTVGNAMIKAYTNNREATAVELVMAQIDALGEIISLDQEPQVVAARTAYDALTQSEKDQVENIAVLEAAEAKIAALKAAQPQPQTTAQTVAAKGNATTGITGVGTGLWVGAGLLAIMLIIGGCYAKKRMM